ncbi:hypothetical protein FA15DRAFT_692398 [Coprinopsis marcescibilis]|uniref:Uncharacterized protein n=1 Tax=Coprinopsis marcescibilis TaxID=230819 RepID=A0A5C3L4C7_COPMA|nr:hypothetical protein FA15DRAFT_692398 [Coprinopsis marcescibilis]
MPLSLKHLALLMERSTYKLIIKYVQVSMVTLGLDTHMWSLASLASFVGGENAAVLRPYLTTGAQITLRQCRPVDASYSWVWEHILQVGKLVLLAKATVPVHYRATVSPQTLNCIAILQNQTVRQSLSAGFALSAASEIVLFLLLCWFAFKKFKECHGSRLYQVFFRDGAIYFVSLTITSIINMLMNLLAPAGLTLVFVPIHTTASVILATRMILHLRQVSQEGLIVAVSWDSQRLDPIQFRQPPSEHTTPGSSSTTSHLFSV